MDHYTSDRFGLPLLASGQAQKETTHNEALAMLDLLVQPVIEGVAADPPAAPAPGACWLVGEAPGGAWTGRAGAIAGWTAGGWRFVSPRTGCRVRRSDGGADLGFDGTGWSADVARVAAVAIAGQQVVGPRRPVIPPPTGGSGSGGDAEARAAIIAILDLLAAHGLMDR